MNYWTTKKGEQIQVKDMELSHVENTLKMLIKKYTLVCVKHGAKHDFDTEIKIDAMAEVEKRNMLNLTCADCKYLKRLVIIDCFGEDLTELW